MARTEEVTQRSRWVALAVSLCMPALTTGCSFAMDVAPHDPSQRTVEAASQCTSSFAAPVADSVSAAIGAVNTAIALSATDEVRIYGIPMKRSAGLALGVTQLAAFGIAATYGFIQGGRCHALRAERHLEEPAKQPVTGVHGSPPPASTAESTSPSYPMNASTDPADAPNAPEPQLPSWSAFRRVELAPPRAPEHTQQSRFASPSP
jgi:hypothetical protein